MRICIFRLILNDTCRNPLYIILEYMLFVLFERIPCNMNMDSYCIVEIIVESPHIQATNLSTCFWRFFLPCSNVVQPLLRSSFGIKSTCRRKCCYWWIYVTWLLYIVVDTHIFPRLTSKGWFRNFWMLDNLNLQQWEPLVFFSKVRVDFVSLLAALAAGCW